MKRGIVRFFGLMMFATLILALVPTAAFAASQSSLSSHAKNTHFFLKSGQQKTAIHAAASNLLYYGGSVMGGTANVYAIYWEPSGNVASGYNSLINRYFNDIGGSTLYHVANQYYDNGGNRPSNSRLAASWTDTRGYPESPLLDSDIQNEVTHAQSTNGWHASVDNIFFVFTQRGQDLCFDSSLSQCASNTFCAYHSNNGSTIYAAMPYAASFQCNPGGRLPNNNDADLTINVTSHEQMEAATDPYPSSGWVDASGSEIGDKCAWTFGTRRSNGANVTFNGHPYLLQKEWSNAKRGCTLS